MYESAEEVIARILALVDKCPENLKERCFEVLLRGYVERELAGLANRTPVTKTPPPDGDHSLGIPEAVLQRFRSTAKRLSINLSALAALFDFGNDPFTFHALTVPGANKAEKTRRVAVLVAAKSYLATGNWVADWQEIKAECINQNCYDSANLAINLRSGEGAAWFKAVESAKNIELTVEGVKEGERLLTQVSQSG